MQAGAAPTVPKYRRKAHLLTEAERKFLAALEQAVENNYRVFAKVRVADVLESDAAPHTPERRSGFKLISRKHFDYVLCGAESSDISCAIELEGPALKSEQQQRWAKLADNICDTAHLPLIRFHLEAHYEPSDIRDQLSKAMGRYAQEQSADTTSEETS